VDENGKKIDGNFERRRSMDVCRELEQQYGLIPADQKQRQEGLPLKPVRYEAGDVKHQISNVVRSIVGDYHFQSLKEYRALLTLYNIGIEEVRGEIRNKAYKGLIYSALNEKGEKVGNPFKSSLIGKSAGIEALEKRFEKSAEIIKQKGLKERSKQVIAEAKRITSNRTDFEKALEKQGVSAIFRTNDEGRIYGATFVDHEQKAVFNGSRLGKDFSANIFNDLYNNNRQTPEPSGQITGQSDEPSHRTDNKFEENTNFGGIFDFFSPTTGSVSDDIQEQAFLRRTKKKRRQQHL
jgi:hypothetical protein